MNHGKKLTLALLILIFTLPLSGCGFRLRSATHVPPQLRTLYIKTLHPYSTFSIQLKNTLRSLNIHLTNSETAAPVTLEIISTILNHSNPTIINSSEAIAYVFYFKIAIALTTADGKIIIPKQIFETEQVIYLNANEIYTVNSKNLASGELYRNAISLIYHWLTAGNTKAALEDYFSKRANHHANLPKPTRKKSH